MGVRVRAKPKGSKVYWVFIAHAGRRRARRVGDRKAAELLKIRLQARLAEGDLSIFDEPASVPSFEQVARRWLVEYPALHQIRPSTLGNYRSFIEGHLIPHFGPSPISAITPSAIEGFIVAKRAPGGSTRWPGRPLADRAIHVGLVALRLILKRAARDGLIPLSPFTHLEWRGSPRVDHIDPFTGAELRALLAAARQVDADLAVMLHLWAQCGARAGEIAGLQWADLDLARGLVTIRRTYSRHRLGPTKTGRERTVSFLHPVLDDVADWRPGSTFLSRSVLGPLRGRPPADPGAFVFTHAGQPLRSGRLHRVWHRVVKLAGVRYREPEQLRHTMASTLLSRQAPLVYVQQVGGWRSANVLLRAYAQWVPDMAAWTQPQESATLVQPSAIPLRLAEGVKGGLGCTSGSRTAASETIYPRPPVCRPPSRVSTASTPSCGRASGASSPSRPTTR
jgi:integrase